VADGDNRRLIVTMRVRLIEINRDSMHPDSVSCVDHSIDVRTTMKQNLIVFAREVNAFCARMNSGLAAVAVVLSVTVAALAAERAQQLVPQISNAVTSGTQVQIGQ
jgi:hypothetical protein